MPQEGALLVPVSNTGASYEALSHAGMVARAQRSPIRVIHVIEVVRSLPVDAEMEWEARQGEQLLRRAEDLAKKEGFHVVTEMLQSRQAGQAIVDEAHAQEASAIVLGMQFRRMVGEFEPGTTTSYVLQHARCPVWVIRESARD